MPAVDEDKVRPVPRLEQEPTDSIGSHAELPLTPNSSHQGEMAGQEIPMSQLYGDTTDNKESTRNTEERDGQDVGKDSSQMVSRLYGDTTDIKESVSPSNAEEKPRLMSELCACGDPTDPDALTRLYENSENKKQYDEDKQSTSALYQAGTPLDEGDQIGDMSATDTAPPGTDTQVEAVNCQTASVTSITTGMLNPMYKHNVPQGATKEGSSVIKAVITGMENPAYRKNVSQRATDQGSVVIKAVITGMENPVYRNNVPQGATDQDISEAEAEHVYENMDVDGKDGNVDSSPTKQRVTQRQSSVHDVPQAAPGAGARAINEGETSCFRRMFRTTFSRLTFAIVIVATMMSVVAMTMFFSKSQPHRPSHRPTPVVESSVSSTMSAEPTTEATMMLPPGNSTALPLNKTTIHHEGKHTCGFGPNRSGQIYNIGNADPVRFGLIRLFNDPPREVDRIPIEPDQASVFGRSPDQTGLVDRLGHIILPATGKCRDCAEIYEGGSTTSGVYLVTLQNNTPVEVYCDMDTDGGGWTVIQRRIDGTVPFNRTWDEYKRGFGNKDGEHWLGNDNIHLLTNQKDYRLQLFFQNKQKNFTYTCSRGFFKVSDERNDYRPDHGKGKPNGNCDLLMRFTFGQAFSTVDRDNDNIQTFNCAERYGGGWWYTNCEQRDGQDVAKESSQMVSRLYGDTTDIKESVSPSNAEEKPRLMSELCACGDPTDPDALTRLYENSENKKQYDEDKQSTSVLYQAGTPPDEGDQIGDMSATGTSPNSNETMPSQEDTAPPGTDTQVEAVNCQTASVTSITTGMLNPMYKHNVPQGETEEGSTVIKAVITGMENPAYRKNVSQRATDQGSMVIKAVITGMENPVYRNNVPQGATDQDISEAEAEHVYENMDVVTPGTDGKEGNVDSSTTKQRVTQRQPPVHDVPQAAPGAGAHAINEGETSCFRRMFRTTFSRLTFAIVIVATMMSVVAMTMFFSKSQPHRSSHRPTPVVESSVSSTMSAEPTTEATTMFISKSQPHRSSHRPTPVVESSVSSTMSAEPTTEATMILPPGNSTALPLNKTTIHHEGNNTCAPGKCRDCAEIYEGGSTTSGVYLVTLQNNTPVEVYCDMDTDGGGWTVIQRRIDGTVPFNRTWEEYKRGFGNKDGEHWLGNDNIHLLTNQKDYRLQLFFQNKQKYFTYTCSRGFFKVSDERNDYRPDHGMGKPNSNCDLLMRFTFGQAFSTVDRDNDNVQTFNCAERYGGGWWYTDCGSSAFLNNQRDRKNRKFCPIKVKPTSLKLKP
ncbi:hypothetical protein Bbelb_197790 [Branchiostoma belcheri]|nr:hypothetical protein Bbelb_197790 [Branchiostoma belcheri]